MPKGRRALCVIGLILLGICALPYGCHLMETAGLRALVPAQLQAGEEVYRSKVISGYGLPGDNETLLAAYSLPEHTSRRIKAEGLSYVSTLYTKKNGYYVWRPTPLYGEDQRLFRTEDDQTDDAYPQGVDIANYLNRFGFGIAVRSDIRRDVNRVLNSAGGYYARGRGGTLIIVSPQQNRVYTAVAG